MHLDEFLEETRCEKSSTLIVIACSSSKRNDDECAELANNLGSIQEKTLSELFPSVSNALKEFRACVNAYNSSAVTKTSRSYPAVLRYSGHFYKSVPVERVGNIWKEIRTKNWNVLILSAYYGFLSVDERIQHYSLRISQLKPACRRKLPAILRSYLETNRNITKTIFFTSKEYTKPFLDRLDVDTHRLSLIDDNGNEIIGPYGRDFYVSAGKLFCFLVSAEPVDKIGGVKEVLLPNVS